MIETAYLLMASVAVTVLIALAGLVLGNIVKEMNK